MTTFQEVEEVIGRAAARTGPAVVSIGRNGGRGAGFVVRDGLVLTSAHNLRGPSVTVGFAGGRAERGEVRAADSEGDLAVIEVTTAGIEPVPWASRPAGLGRAVLAVGPPRGVRSGRVTLGHVSAVGVAFRGPRGRLIEDGFEHTALVGRGSSGGPVLDSTGALVGINTHRPGDGFYLAVPADEALAGRVDKLARGETPVRRQLGVALVPPPLARRLRAAVGLEARDGLLVRHVDADGPAGQAGVKPGDLIIVAGGHETATVDALVAAVDAHEGDGPFPVTAVRGTETVSFEVRFPPPGAA